MSAPRRFSRSRLAEIARRWLLIAAGTAFIGLLNFFVVVTSWRAEGKSTPVRLALVWEMTGALSFFVLLPALLPFLRRFHLTRRNLGRYLPLHAAFFVVFGMSHTLLMWGSRILVYRLLGWGAYSYGDMRYRFLMEGGKQVIIYCAIYGIVAAIEYVRVNRERELGAARVARQLTEARLQALKMQLHPHFLFNALNMISAHVHDAPQTAETMIMHLSDFLRMTLRHSDTQEVRLSTELEFLSAYLEIMRARFEERLTVEVEADEEARACLVPHLVLQPLVENAITHALRDGGEGAWLRVSAARAGGRLRLAIEDNGPGLVDAAQQRRGLGVGLRNTSERLRCLYDADQRLSLSERAGGGVRLEIEVPFRREAAPAEHPA